MKFLHQRGWQRAWHTLAWALALAGTASAAEYLNWDKEKQSVSANIQTWDVTPLLEQVATHTGWHVYLQPDTKQVVPTRFRDLSEGEALRRLLGDLSYVRLPSTNGPPRLYVFRTSRDDATQLIRAAPPARQTNAPQAIADEAIVVLKPGEKIDDLARQLGAKVLGRADELNAYRLKFKDAESARRAREALRGNSSVASVDNNHAVAGPESPDAIGLPPPRLSLQPKAVSDGKYMIVGLIDSAVQPQEGRFGDFILSPLSVAGDTKPSSDQPTHGTAMSETILNGLAEVVSKGSATAVRILPVDVYGDRTSTTTFEVAFGIYKAINAGANIINLSMGSEGDTTLLRDVIKSGRDQGVLFFAAAGNEPTTQPTFPAAYPEVVAVTAEDRRGNLADYANRGEFVDVAAPDKALITFGERTYVIGGTSTSTAFTSGLAAGLREKTKKPLGDVEAAIRQMMSVKKAPAPAAGRVP